MISDGCSRQMVIPGQPAILPYMSCAAQPLGIVGHSYDGNGNLSGMSQLGGVAAPGLGKMGSATLPALAAPTEMAVHVDNMPAGADVEIAHVSGVWQDEQQLTPVPAGALDIQLGAPTPGWKWHMTTGIEWKPQTYGVVVDPVAEGAASYTLDANDVPAGGLDVVECRAGTR